MEIDVKSNAVICMMGQGIANCWIGGSEVAGVLRETDAGGSGNWSLFTIVLILSDPAGNTLLGIS